MSDLIYNISIDDFSMLKIEELGFSKKTNKFLKESNINTISDLTELSVENLSDVKNLGAKGLNEILSTLQKVKEIGVFDLNIDGIFNEENSNSQIRGEFIIEREKEKLFLSKDGYECVDLPLEKLNLSRRAYNCLKREGMNYVSDLVSADENYFLNIKNMGEKTALEIKNIISNIELIQEKETFEYVGEMEDVSKKLPQLSDLVIYKIFQEISSLVPVNIINVNRELKYVVSLYLEENISMTSVDALMDDEVFLSAINASPYMQNLAEQIIITIIRKSAYGLRLEEIANNLPHIFIGDYIDKTIAQMVENNILELVFNNRYVEKLKNFEIGLKETLKEIEYEIIIGRCKGKTLDEVGQIYNLTRERIRQIESRILQRLDLEGVLFREDIYADIFKRYVLTSEDFALSLKCDISTFNYLTLRYNTKSDNKDSKLPIEQILDDIEIPNALKKSFEKAIYKNYIKIFTEYIPCTRTDISNFVIRNFGGDGITFSEFSEFYLSIVEGIESDDSKLFNMDRGYENRLATSDMVLWKYGKKFRYYNIKQYDFDELLNTLELNKYDNVEYSTLKFFRLYPELMQSYDIRDEYELHNLLKKICNKDEYPNLNFKRMPNIEFGTADRDEQVLELLIALAPIKHTDFAREYENIYGVLDTTVLANFMKSFEPYFHDGMYEIDCSILPFDKSQEFKNILTDDFYLLADVKKLYNEQFPDLDKKLLNPFTLKNIGFRIYSNYIISDKYSSATEFFNHMLTKDNVFSVLRMKNDFREIYSYTSELYKRKADYEIVEYLPNEYINISELNKRGITKEILESYCLDVEKFIEKGKYFTINSLKCEGFSHQLHDYGFDDWFYASILAEAKEKYSFQRIGGNKLFKRGTNKVIFEELLENIVYSRESFSIWFDDLVYHLESYFKIRINVFKFKDILKNSCLFFDAIFGKVYADYDYYCAENKISEVPNV